MELNLIVLAGRVAAEPEVRVFASGASLIRYLVTVRSMEPTRRVDVLPVTKWNPDDDEVAKAADARGRRVWVAGAVQRRFWSTGDGKSSRLEIVAHDVRIRKDTDADEDEAHARV